MLLCEAGDYAEARWLLGPGVDGFLDERLGDLNQVGEDTYAMEPKDPRVVGPAKLQAVQFCARLSLLSEPTTNWGVSSCSRTIASVGTE